MRIMQEECSDRAGENARDEGFEESHGYSIALTVGLVISSSTRP